MGNVVSGQQAEILRSGFFAYPLEKVYSRHYPVVTDGAEGVSPWWSILERIPI
jgi:hypothetical protein